MSFQLVTEKKKEKQNKNIHLLLEKNAFFFPFRGVICCLKTSFSITGTLKELLLHQRLLLHLDNLHFLCFLLFSSNFNFFDFIFFFLLDLIQFFVLIFISSFITVASIFARGRPPTSICSLRPLWGLETHFGTKVNPFKRSWRHFSNHFFSFTRSRIEEASVFIMPDKDQIDTEKFPQHRGCCSLILSSYPSPPPSKKNVFPPPQNGVQKADHAPQ